jgi:type II secretory pathway predicted ATPase ExeA
MSKEMMNYFNLTKDFRDAGYYETEHHKIISQEIIQAIKSGKLIALSGIVGSGKTTILKKIQDKLNGDRDIQISKSLSLEKERVTLTMLTMAMFYDLSTEKDVKIPTQPEKRIRALRELVRKRNKTVALFVDEAHDLHAKTLVSLKRLMESIQDAGGSLAIVLAGHPKLHNDLKRPSFEEIGTRATLITLDGITASKREYIIWMMESCTHKQLELDSIITEDAVDVLADKLITPLQIQHYTTLAFEEAFKIGAKPVTDELVNTVITRGINDLEPRLIRYGYNLKTLSDMLNVRPKVIRSFLRGQLTPGQTQEIHNDMLALGIPL